MVGEVIVTKSGDVPSDFVELQHFYEYWLTLRSEDQLPRFDDFDPDLVEQWRPHLRMLRLQYPGPVLWIEYVGEALKWLAPMDMTGHKLGDIYGGKNWPAYENALVSTARDEAPCYITSGFTGRSDHYLIEVVAVPLRTDRDIADHILTMLFWHDKDVQWPSFDQDGFLRHHHLLSNDRC